MHRVPKIGLHLHGFYLAIRHILLNNPVPLQTLPALPAALLDPEQATTLAAYLPELGSNLVTTLSSLDVNNLTHDESAL